MDGIGKARKSLEKNGFERYRGDVNTINYSENERADVLLPDGSREVWFKPRSRGRPSTNFDKKAYQRQYMADKRQAEKLGVSVREYRDAVKNGR